MLFSNSVLYQWLWVCCYVWRRLSTVVESCDWTSNNWDPLGQVWERCCTRDAHGKSVLPFPCRCLAVRDNVQIIFWGNSRSYTLYDFFWTIILFLFLASGYLSQSLIELFNVMCSDDPNIRPLVSSALETLREVQRDVSPEALPSRVPYSPVQIERVAALGAELSAYIAERDAKKL